MKKIAVGNVGHEELARMKLVTENRAQARIGARALFPSVAEDAQKRDSKLMKSLFVQTPGAETMAPVLTEINKTAAVDSWVEKYSSMSDAQRRFPELLKVARPMPDLKKRNQVNATSTGPTGTFPTQSSLSGGSA